MVYWFEWLVCMFDLQEEAFTDVAPGYNISGYGYQCLL